MGLIRIIELRDAVNALCAGIDAGEFKPTEGEMLAVAQVVAQEAGPLKLDLLCKIASRCENGRAVLKQMAQ